MLKRVTTIVPRTASRILATNVRVGVSSPSQVAAPSVVAARRNYHEKDEFQSFIYFFCLRTYLSNVRSGSLELHANIPSLLDHYSKPRNVGSMAKGDLDVGTGLVGAPACGDVMKLQIRVDPNSNTISDVKFKTFGCGSAIASSSYLTELVRGMTLEDAGKIRNTEIARELCLPPVKRMF